MSLGKPPRERWVDVAKGGAIVLVVLYHSSLFLDDVELASFWSRAGTALDTFRMPLFFFTAGLFAARTLSLDLRGVLGRRVWNLLWVYVVWSLIWTLAFQVLPFLRDLPTWEAFLLIFVWPHASTWFVYALALYFLVAWAIRRLPVAVQLGLAGVLAVVFGTGAIQSGNTALDKMGMYFVFFLAAARFGPLARAAAGRLTARRTALAAAGYLVAMAGLATRDDPFALPGVRLAVSCLAVVVGVGLAVALSGWRMFGWLEFLGRRTLPVYVLHFYPILVLCALIEPFARSLGPVAPVLPPVLTAGVIVVALVIGRVTRRVPGLYSLPTVLQQWATAGDRRAPS